MHSVGDFVTNKSISASRKAATPTQRILARMSHMGVQLVDVFDMDRGDTIAKTEIEADLAEALETTVAWLRDGFDVLCDANGALLRARPVGGAAQRQADAPVLDLRVDPEELRLPGIVVTSVWERSAEIARYVEERVFGQKLSPLNRALLFRNIYVRFLEREDEKMQLRASTAFAD